MNDSTRSPVEQIFFDGMRAGKCFLDFFSYSSQWNTLGATTTTTNNVSISSDSDFVLQMINISSFSAAGTIVVNPDYRINLVDGGSGRQLFDAAQHVGNVCGSQRNSGAEPFSLPMAKLIRGGSVLSVTLQNMTGTSSLVDLSLVGFKVFYNDQNSRSSLIGIN